MMTKFTTHTRDTVPDEAQPLFDAASTKFGFTPNLIRVLAESPTAAEAYLALSDIFARSTLSTVEQQIVLLAASVHNRCEYCVAAHSAGAIMAKADPEVVEAIRSAASAPDPRLDALSQFTREVVRRRGWVTDEAVRSFLDAGYSRAGVFEVLLGVTLKTLSNYANHIAHPVLDAELEGFAWRANSGTDSAEAA